MKYILFSMPSNYGGPFLFFIPSKNFNMFIREYDMIFHPSDEGKTNFKFKVANYCMTAIDIAEATGAKMFKDLITSRENWFKTLEESLKKYNTDPNISLKNKYKLMTLLEAKKRIKQIDANGEIESMVYFSNKISKKPNENFNFQNDLSSKRQINGTKIYVKDLSYLECEIMRSFVFCSCQRHVAFIRLIQGIKSNEDFYSRLRNNNAFIKNINKKPKTENQVTQQINN